MVLKDFLTDKEIQQAWEIYEEDGYGCGGRFVKRCEDEVIRPNMSVIEMKLLQECDSRFLAYSVLFVFNEVCKAKRNGK
jgi:hypothetical protein